MDNSQTRFHGVNEGEIPHAVKALSNILQAIAERGTLVLWSLEGEEKNNQ